MKDRRLSQSTSTRLGGDVMVSGIDIGARVKVKDTSPLHPDERGVILRLGLTRDVTAWVVKLAHGDVEIPESDLELVERSRL